MKKKVRTTTKEKAKPAYKIVRATLTSKGQLTLPVEVRRTYGLEAGDEIAFKIAEDGLQVTPIKRRPASSFLGALPATRPFPGVEAEKKAVAEARTRLYRKKLGLKVPAR